MLLSFFFFYSLNILARGAGLSGVVFIYFRFCFSLWCCCFRCRCCWSWRCCCWCVGCLRCRAAALLMLCCCSCRCIAAASSSPQSPNKEIQEKHEVVKWVAVFKCSRVQVCRRDSRSEAIGGWPAPRHQTGRQGVPRQVANCY